MKTVNVNNIIYYISTDNRVFTAIAGRLVECILSLDDLGISLAFPS